MSIYLTKKALKELAICLDAKKLSNNIYYYENIIHSFSKLIQALDLVDCVDIESGYICVDQIAYSAGMYGNNGQLHKITYYDELKDCIFTKFIYVC